jgi:precorrin-6B C5,15-methyltransferase / cobalt-precorrin-6B C5,C15-methyltransferase
LNKISIIGVAPYGLCSLTPKIRRIVKRADLVFGGSRLLAQFDFVTGEKIPIENNLPELISIINQKRSIQKIVVLASGDPDFFGIASYIKEHIGSEEIEIFPNISSMQIAFALIKENWEDAFFYSVHGRGLDKVSEVVSGHSKIGIFTDSVNTPAKIATLLLNNGISGYSAFVCQKVGMNGQKIFRTDIAGLCRLECDPLNILILKKEDGKNIPNSYEQFHLGIPDNEFLQRRPNEGLITKQEVRAICLAKMKLNPSSTIWDIGAGSGAISIEASILAWKGNVFAVEKNQEDVDIIKENLRRFNRTNITVIHGQASEKMSELPDPAAVFIGGSGGELPEILKIVVSKLKNSGTIVINIATLENLAVVQGELKRHGLNYEIIQVNLARSRSFSDLTRLQPLNPVFIITAQKEDERCLKEKTIPG